MDREKVRKRCDELLRNKWHENMMKNWNLCVAWFDVFACICRMHGLVRMLIHRWRRRHRCCCRLFATQKTQNVLIPILLSLLLWLFHQRPNKKNIIKQGVGMNAVQYTVYMGKGYDIIYIYIHIFLEDWRLVTYIYMHIYVFIFMVVNWQTKKASILILFFCAGRSRLSQFVWHAHARISAYVSVSMLLFYTLEMLLFSCRRLFHSLCFFLFWSVFCRTKATYGPIYITIIRRRTSEKKWQATSTKE